MGINTGWFVLGIIAGYLLKSFQDYLNRSIDKK